MKDCNPSEYALRTDLIQFYPYDTFWCIAISGRDKKNYKKAAGFNLAAFFFKGRSIFGAR